INRTQRIDSSVVLSQLSTLWKIIIDKSLLLRSAAKNGRSEGSARQSAIHHQLDRVDVRRIVRSKKKHSLGQFFRLAPTSKWNRGREEVGKFCGFLLSGTGARPALPDGSFR